ncbi:MAG TPA: GNAT family N-acetyltransferase [Allosphingosinicella sp.]|uniref:GNAT family N-acetyltransferase n=1 Tax=Allosphingosinicella sp. TaxID=2823234 RepID=UPI002EDB2D5D
MNADSLNRPIWNALAGRQAAFATGGDKAKRFLPDVNMLAGIADDTPPALEALADLVPQEGKLILLQAGESPPLPPSLVDHVDAGVQMVAERAIAAPAAHPAIPLGDADAPEMLALATLTEPGPFLPRTHLLGGFWGIREDGRLAAMAGERLRLDGLTEVSGVCTHPDFRGRGYARLLSQLVASRIQARGETPFLHAYAVNEAAIGLYRSLGFRLRAEMSVTVLMRE